MAPVLKIAFPYKIWSATNNKKNKRDISNASFLKKDSPLFKFFNIKIMAARNITGSTSVIGGILRWQ